MKDEHSFEHIGTFDEFDKVRVSESRYKEFMKFITDFLKSGDDADPNYSVFIHFKTTNLLSEGKES